ncbi:MAG: protein kinase [Deltaproteobacteria bacterium]|nr:protein kinase [Deltaproteobacteria bacterium]MBW2072207.1 protein kinase [Deltaproteobacteria bacterium]
MRRRQVLLIHDQADAVEQCAKILARADYSITIATEGDAAIQLAQEKLPDVVLLGIQSQKLKGMQLLKRLQQRGTTSNLPVVLLLEKFDEEYVAQGLAMGAADYLVKPFDSETVLARVGVLARLRQQQRLRQDILTRYHELFEGEQHGLFISTREGRFLDMNDTLVQMLGYESKEELLNLDLPKDLYCDPDDRARFQEIIEKEGFIENFRVAFKRKDGQQITILLNGKVVRDEKGAIVGYEGYNVDVSTLSSEVGHGTALEEDNGRQGFFTRLWKYFGPKVAPMGGDLLSVIKTTELIGGRYEKIKRLGFGSFSEIWKVRDIERRGSPPFFVVKIPRSTKLNAQFRKEASICERLQDHPSAVKIIEVLEERGRVILVQEYVQGETLRILMERPLETEEIESIIRQLVDITAYAHKRRIVHRDIKPENIIIRKDGILKLLDYGVAKELGDEDMSSTLVGSRPYMAPEQIMGRSQVASDVWAIGVLMYILYTECLPFYGDNEKTMTDMILEREPLPPREIVPGLPAELEAIILHCLQKDPGKRFPDASALQEALSKIYAVDK